jgi:hypothetical protein
VVLKETYWDHSTVVLGLSLELRFRRDTAAKMQRLRLTIQALGAGRVLSALQPKTAAIKSNAIVATSLAFTLAVARATRISKVGPHCQMLLSELR